MSREGDTSGQAPAAPTDDAPGLRDVAVASLLTCVSGLFFWFHRSRWLDDWDSVQFALALDRLSLAEHRPHPPGYFAYVFTARGLDVWIHDAPLSLVILSVLAGALTVGLLYTTGRLLHGWMTGLIAAGMLFATPAFSKSSVVAMGDVVVLPCFLGALVCGLLGRRAHATAPGSRAALLFVMAGALAAWGAGVRPQWSVHLVLLLLALAVSCTTPRAWLGLGLGGVLGTGAWLLPALRELDMGLGDYLRAGAQQYGAQPSSRAKISLEHLGEYMTTWVLEWELEFAAFVGASLVCVVVVALRHRSTLTKSLQIGIVGSLVFALLGVVEALWLHPLAFRRVLLPAAPFVALLFAIPCGLLFTSLRSEVARRAMIVGAGVLLSLGVAGAQTRAREFDASRPPPVEAAHFVAEQFEGERVLVVAGKSFRHFQHYLPEAVDLQWRDSFVWGPSLNRGEYTVLVTDWALPGLEPSRSARFERLPQIYAKHQRVSLYAYELAELRFVLDEGIYHRERWGFWTSDEARGWVRADVRGGGDLRLSVHSAFETPRTLELTLEEAAAPVFRAQVGGPRQTLQVGLALERRWQRVALTAAEGCESGEGRGVSNDARCLAFAVHEAKVGPAYYALGDTLRFAADEVARGQLRQGWSSPEAWGVWSNEASATLALVLAESVGDETLRLEFDARVLVGDSTPPTLEVLANGELVGRWTAEDGDFHQPAWTFPGALIGPDGQLELVLRVTPMRSPVELQLGQDPRKLGVALRSARLDVQTPESPSTRAH